MQGMKFHKFHTTNVVTDNISWNKGEKSYEKKMFGDWNHSLVYCDSG